MKLELFGDRQARLIWLPWEECFQSGHLRLPNPEPMTMIVAGSWAGEYSFVDDSLLRPHYVADGAYLGYLCRYLKSGELSAGEVTAAEYAVRIVREVNRDVEPEVDTKLAPAGDLKGCYPLSAKDRWKSQVGRYVADSCKKTDKNSCLPFKDLYEGYVKWASGGDLLKMSKRMFSRFLSELGFVVMPGSGNKSNVHGLSFNYHRHNEDDIQTFITETCDLVLGSKITVKYLYRRYVAWCEESGITPMNKKMLSNTIKERGYEVRTGTGNILFCHGISPNRKESDCYSPSDPSDRNQSFIRGCEYARPLVR